MSQKLVMMRHLGFAQEYSLPDNCKATIEDGNTLCVYQEIPEPWNGEGLPPVGAVCEFKSVGHHSDPEYQWCIYHGRMSCGGYIVEYHHQTSPGMTTCAPFDPGLTYFRTIRTPEQIAAEERRKSAIALYEAVMNFGKLAFDRLPLDRQEHYLKLVDAGWQQVKS